MLRAMKHAATVALSASPVVTFGAWQMLGSSATPQWSAIGADLVDGRFWLTVVVMLLGGAFGGVSYELLLRGGAIELPHRVKPDSGGRSYSHAPPETLVALGTMNRDRPHPTPTPDALRVPNAAPAGRAA
jgi:hypothetical protein